MTYLLALRTWNAFNKMSITILFLLVALATFVIVPIPRIVRRKLFLLALAFIDTARRCGWWWRLMLMIVLLSIDRESVWSDVSVISGEKRKAR